MAAFRRDELGFVFQDFNLFPNLNVLQNITLAPTMVLKESKAEAEQNAQKLLDQLQMNGREKQYPYQLSGGQKQRVALARALAMKPDVLLLDEPTSALDPELVGEVEKSIAEAAKSGQTMILVSHDMAFVEQVADKVLFLDKGHIIEAGTPAEVMGNPKEERTKEFFANYKRTFI